jgi:uncharacterized protein YcbX
LVISEASIQDLNTRLVADGFPEIDESRFRPNIVLTDCESYAEDTAGRLYIGDDVVIRAVKKCSRCMVIDTDQTSGELGRGVLATLAKYRRDGKKVFFGMNYVVEKPGSILKVSRVF